MTCKDECIKKLSGHSGCVIELRKKNDELFIRKSAGSIEYNHRLKRQFIKQKKFNLEYAKTPKILRYGKDKNVFYFDMEFINAITMAEYMHIIKVKEIVDFMKILFFSLKINESSINPYADKIFRNKIKELSLKICKTNHIIKEAICVLTNHDFSNIPQSHCCGDLTLENILIAPTGKIYVIDLLDSFYNSWMIDVAKLLQDIDIGWSYRNLQMDYNLNLRLEIAKQSLIENILQLENGKFLLKEIYYILLLNLIRIYPYSSDQDTIEFLDNSVKKTLAKIKEMEL